MGLFVAAVLPYAVLYTVQLQTSSVAPFKSQYRNILTVFVVQLVPLLVMQMHHSQLVTCNCFDEKSDDVRVCMTSDVFKPNDIKAA